MVDPCTSEPRRTQRRYVKEHPPLVASSELSGRSADLPLVESAPSRGTAPRAHHAPSAGALWHTAGVELPLRAHQPRDLRALTGDALHHPAGAWGTGSGCEHVSGGYVHRYLPPDRLG